MGAPGAPADASPPPLPPTRLHDPPPRADNPRVIDAPTTRGTADGAEPDPSAARLRIQTLGSFRLWRAGVELPPGVWERDKALQLFQFFVTLRRRRLTKEQIVDQLWPAVDAAAGDRDFKVALNAVHRALEPDRPPRSEPRFVRRFGPAYGLDVDAVWIDAEAMEAHIAAAHAAWPADPDGSRAHLRAAAALYAGDYLPERRYEDWASVETERLQTLALGAMVRLAELSVGVNPLESIHLTQRVLQVDPVWEDAWRTQIAAHLAQGNRALAARAWQRCAETMRRELGLEPLPETRAVFETAGGRAARPPALEGEPA